MLSRRKETPPPPPIGGVNVAAITPRRQREVEVDLGAMLELVDFLGSRQVDGITLFGTTGEFVHFTLEERSRYVALLAKRSRVPVLANVSHSTLDGAIAMAEEAAGAGIAGVVIMPPYFYRYPAEAVETFFLHFAEHVSKWVRVLLCNIPVFADPIPAESVERLMATGMFAGIKDSSGLWANMTALLEIRVRHPFTLLSGDDRLFARARQAGADGGVSGVACAVPELMLAIDRAIRREDRESAARLDARLQEFVSAISELPVPIGVKTALAARGIKAGPDAAPSGREGQLRIDQFRSWFAAWLPLIQAELKDATPV